MRTQDVARFVPDAAPSSSLLAQHGSDPSKTFTHLLKTQQYSTPLASSANSGR